MEVAVEVVAVVATLLAIAAIYGLARRRRPETAPGGDHDRLPVALVPLRTTYVAAEADIIRGLLEAHGVPSIVSTDDAGGWRAEGLWRPARVLVREEDLGHAEELLASAAAPDAAPG